MGIAMDVQPPGATQSTGLYDYQDGTAMRRQRSAPAWVGTSTCAVPSVAGEASLRQSARVPDTTTDAYAAAPPYLVARDPLQTDTATRSTVMVVLDDLARADAPQVFAALAEGVEWSIHDPGDLCSVIRLAVALDLGILAEHLVRLGRELFPTDDGIRRLAKVLAPPVARRAVTPNVAGLAASRTWLADHASEYRGQWVAVRDGRLVGAAASLRELQRIIAEDPVSTVVTRVL